MVLPVHDLDSTIKFSSSRCFWVFSRWKLFPRIIMWFELLHLMVPPTISVSLSARLLFNMKICGAPLMESDDKVLHRHPPRLPHFRVIEIPFSERFFWCRTLVPGKQKWKTESCCSNLVDFKLQLERLLLQSFQAIWARCYQAIRRACSDFLGKCISKETFERRRKICVRKFEQENSEGCVAFWENSFLGEKIFGYARLWKFFSSARAARNAMLLQMFLNS